MDWPINMDIYVLATLVVVLLGGSYNRIINIMFLILLLPVIVFILVFLNIYVSVPKIRSSHLHLIQFVFSSTSLITGCVKGLFQFVVSLPTTNSEL